MHLTSNACLWSCLHACLLVCSSHLVSAAHLCGVHFPDALHHLPFLDTAQVLLTLWLSCLSACW